MGEAQINYRLMHLIALAQVGELLGEEAGLSDEQVDNLVKWGEDTFAAIGDDSAIAERLREVAQELYEELEELFEEEITE